MVKIVEKKASDFSSGTSADSFGIGNNTANKTYLRSFQPNFDPYIAYDPVLKTWVKKDTFDSAEEPLGPPFTTVDDFITKEVGFHHTNQKPITPAYGLLSMTRLVDSGFAVVKVSLAAGANNHDKLIAALASAGVGDVVWIDISGFDETFVGNELSISTQIHLIGYSEDPAATILRLDLSGTGSLNLLTLTTSGTGALWKDRVVVANMTLDGGGYIGGSSSRGIDAVFQSHLTIENVVSANFETYGFNIQTSSSEDIIIKDCICYGNGVGLKVSTGQATDLKILNCVAHSNRSLTGGTTGAGFYVIPQLVRFVMRDCSAIGNQESGFQTEQFTQDSIIENCLFENNGWDQAAFNPTGCKVSQGNSENVDGLTFRRCVFRHNGLRAPFTDTDGNDRGIGLLFKVRSATCKDILIEYCTFDNNGHLGIHWHGRDGSAPTTNNFVVRNCNFYNHEFAGLGMDNLGSTSDQVITATGNYWGTNDGPSGTGPGTGDATLTSTAYGAKRVANVGETLQTSIIVLTTV